MPSKKTVAKSNSEQDILEGVDAIGTIIEEDLNYIKKRFAELQESFTAVNSELASMRLDQKVQENNQVEILETLKFLVDKLDHLEVKMSANLIHEKTVDDLDDDR
jgi:tRNA A37 threonylcarbamoyladenosine dehydratase